MYCGNLIFFLLLGCSGHVTISWPIREILLVGVGGAICVRKVFLLHKNGSSTAFPSLPACTVTSEDVLSGAVAATLQSRGDKPGERSQPAYDGRQQAQKELGSLVR